MSKFGDRRAEEMQPPRLGKYFRIILGSGAVGTAVTLVTAALAIAGVLEMGVASALLIVAWAIVVIGTLTAEAISSKSLKHRASVTIVVALVVGVPIYRLNEWMLVKSAQEAIRRNVSIEVRKPSSGNVYGSVATVANGQGSGVTVGQHRIICQVIKLTSRNDVTIEGGISFEHQSEGEIMVPGDSQSETCPPSDAIRISEDVACADVLVRFIYSPIEYPNKQDEVVRRFVTRNDHGILDWYGQPVSHSGTYCR